MTSIQQAACGANGQSGVGPSRQEPHPDAVQPGHDPVDDDRHRDGGKHEGSQDRPPSGNQVPIDRLSTVRVGKTALQIMIAGWCVA
ncbi:hypothetical protein [Knoellia sp. p5-6-4]|uniref:hypothetical protein n=1 Tax=unclassified Knoellia TaxID=2618719 RepID=UPI0023DAD1A0|nr:hypothetical protein [Knoellia sp. p5-6-4]MDF2143527.1 hypothetical protein [Knoellia sp. p5-6-4]